MKALPQVPIKLHIDNSHSFNKSTIIISIFELCKMHPFSVFVATCLGLVAASPVPGAPGPDTDDYSIIVGYKYTNQSVDLFDIIADGKKVPYLSSGPVESFYITTSGSKHNPVYDVASCFLYNVEGGYAGAFAAEQPGYFELYTPTVVASLECNVGYNCTTCSID
ncbi:hypothetical protein PT974_01612 [Cladobotryum mycophilum]|uniref:Uncharacterized protein n=1 Tax=Cladobotryum mycophilum TaxID=491253 RepID=A0ABR0T453_9HYPO